MNREQKEILVETIGRRLGRVFKRDAGLRKMVLNGLMKLSGAELSGLDAMIFTTSSFIEGEEEEKEERGPLPFEDAKRMVAEEIEEMSGEEGFLSQVREDKNWDEILASLDEEGFSRREEAFSFVLNAIAPCEQRIYS